MNIVDELTEYFRKFPGVGPRQASRFVYYLIRVNSEKKNRIADLIKDLDQKITQCNFCYKTFLKRENQDNQLCNICRDKNRDISKIFIIENDTDLETIESTSIYNGRYFVIGSLIKILDKNYHKKIHLDDLIMTLNKNSEIQELIFGLDATPDGENTINIFKKEIKEKINREIKLSVLGRGLSTGTEIEYIDQETLRNALNNRI
jgi:recombination protein RecR